MFFFVVGYLGHYNDIVAKCMKMRIKVDKDNKLQKPLNYKYI